MTHGQGRERPRAEFMRKMKCRPQRLVREQEWWNLPQVQSEWTPAKERREHPRHWLAEKQRIKPVFTQFDRSAMELAHLCGEGRQARVARLGEAP